MEPVRPLHRAILRHELLGNCHPPEGVHLVQLLPQVHGDINHAGGIKNLKPCEHQSMQRQSWQPVAYIALIDISMDLLQSVTRVAQFAQLSNDIFRLFGQKVDSFIGRRAAEAGTAAPHRPSHVAADRLQRSQLHPVVINGILVPG